jgi:hypothetical protein
MQSGYITSSGNIAELKASFSQQDCTLGGHFYLTSNLQDTFYSIVHCFMGNLLLTNMAHQPIRKLLIRMMQYFYKCFIKGMDDDEQ